MVSFVEFYSKRKKRKKHKKRKKRKKTPIFFRRDWQKNKNVKKFP